jgi:Flp pilus assembly protein TadB
MAEFIVLWINALIAFLVLFREEPLGVLGGVFILYIAFFPRSGAFRYREKQRQKRKRPA